MKVPPLLLGVALLVWGWQVEQLLLAGGLALLLESPRWVRWRWPLSDKEINRSVDVCAMVFSLLAGYGMLTGPVADAIFMALGWTPVILAPLLLIQQYSERDGLPLSALSMHQRKWGDSGRTVDVSYPYFVICLLAASIGNRSPWLFYLCLVVLWAWALWRHRNRRFAPGTCLLLTLMGGGGGYLVYGGLVQLQLTLEEHIPGWILGWFDVDTDPYRRTTAMGSIGRLKTSSRIVLRVGQDAGVVPGLLRTASYNVLNGGTWFASTGIFQAWQNQTMPSRASSQDSARVDILQAVKNGRGMLSLPLGAYRIHGIPSEDMERNPLGAVKVREAPRLLRYQVDYDPHSEVDFPPTENDTRIPEHYREVLAEFAEQMGLPVQTPANIPAVMERYFQEQFSYSLDLWTVLSDSPPLLDFLNHTRSGHCEYFASAAVLLLRQAGIPARYAAGFSVQEYSPLEGRYIVRRRHAHAWAMAYIDGYWRNVDTTPAAWVEADAAQASSWAGVYDVLSWLWVRFAEWRMRQDHSLSAPTGLLLGLLFCLVCALWWRLRRRGQIRSRPPKALTPVRMHRTGGDSACYRIVDWYAAQGLQRPSGTPLAAWLLDMDSGNDRQRQERLAEILRLHYRYRFDPLGITRNERRILNQWVSAWLEQENEH